MSGANGIETAKELRDFDSDALLIFTTTSTDHALEGFRVRAMHYLVKPYEEKELSGPDSTRSSPGFHLREKYHRCQSERE